MNDTSDLKAYVERLGRAARRAAQQLATLDGATRTAALREIAAGIRREMPALIAANARDLEAATAAELAPALVERLKLTEKRVAAMADGVEQIAGQVDPVGQIIEGYVRPNGLRITKMRVPIGVVCFFYESRPNVTSDAAALCLKSGNAIILRGGKEAIHSNRAIAGIIGEALVRIGTKARRHEGTKEEDGGGSSSSPQSFVLSPQSCIDPAAVQLVESTDRALVPHLLKLDQYIDLVIPRGGESLIRAVVKESTIPVLKHFTGVCHIYVDAATQDMAAEVTNICVNAKTSYPGGAVCNAVEKILFHRDAAARLLPQVCDALAAAGVEIRGDEATRALWPKAEPANDADWDTEYLALIVTIGVVDSLDAAIDHINTHGSRHTDAILSSDVRAIDRFTKAVDTASVIVNASTRFADGGEYGLGAEIGISTDKMHARGPMGAMDLTTYKWVVTGEGHVRT